MAVGDTKVKNNITYRLNKNHRWEKVGRATSPGQTSLFDLPIIPDTPLTPKDNAHKLKGSKGKGKAMTTATATKWATIRTEDDTMKFTKSQAQLIEDAKAAGYSVQESATSVDIFKATKAGRITRGIRICEDGTAFRLDVELGSANTIRTQKVMRSILFAV
jgi:hypothetical protein